MNMLTSLNRTTRLFPLQPLPALKQPETPQIKLLKKIEFTRSSPEIKANFLYTERVTDNFKSIQQAMFLFGRTEFDTDAIRYNLESLKITAKNIIDAKGNVSKETADNFLSNINSVLQRGYIDFSGKGNDRIQQLMQTGIQVKTAEGTLTFSLGDPKQQETFNEVMQGLYKIQKADFPLFETAGKVLELLTLPPQKWNRLEQVLRDFKSELNGWVNILQNASPPLQRSQTLLIPRKNPTRSILRKSQTLLIPQRKALLLVPSIQG